MSRHTLHCRYIVESGKLEAEISGGVGVVCSYGRGSYFGEQTLTQSDSVARGATVTVTSE